MKRTMAVVGRRQASVSYNYTVHLCRFATLDSLCYRRGISEPQKYEEAVLTLLKREGRFSCFEVNARLAKLLDDLISRKIIRYTNKGQYPWVTVAVKAQL